MSRGKSKSQAQFEHVLSVLVSNPESRDTGRIVSVAELHELLAGKICLGRMSVYMWEIKSRGIVVKPIRDGRKVVSYQILNIQTANAYLADRGFNVSTTVADPEQIAEESVEEEMIHE